MWAPSRAKGKPPEAAILRWATLSQVRSGVRGDFFSFAVSPWSETHRRGSFQSDPKPVGYGIPMGTQMAQ